MKKQTIKIKEKRKKDYFDNSKIDAEFAKLKNSRIDTCSSCGEEYVIGRKCCNGEWL